MSRRSSKDFIMIHWQTFFWKPNLKKNLKKAKRGSNKIKTKDLKERFWLASHHRRTFPINNELPEIQFEWKIIFFCQLNLNKLSLTMHLDMSNSFKGTKDNNRLYFIYVVTNMIDMDNLLSLLEFHFIKLVIFKIMLLVISLSFWSIMP